MLSSEDNNLAVGKMSYIELITFRAKMLVLLQSMVIAMLF